MTKERDVDLYGNELFRAGEPAPPGRYQLLDNSLTIELQQEGVLPGRQNGHESCYVRVEFWGDAAHRSPAAHGLRHADGGDTLGQ
jgi:hypothetical protein